LSAREAPLGVVPQGAFALHVSSYVRRSRLPRPPVPRVAGRSPQGMRGAPVAPPPPVAPPARESRRR